MNADSVKAKLKNFAVTFVVSKFFRKFIFDHSVCGYYPDSVSSRAASISRR